MSEQKPLFKLIVNDSGLLEPDRKSLIDGYGRMSLRNEANLRMLQMVSDHINHYGIDPLPSDPHDIEIPRVKSTRRLEPDEAA